MPLALFSTGASTQAPAFLSRRSDRARARIAGCLEGGAVRPVADVRTGATTCSSTSEHKPSGLRAKNINTIDEVPDSSWFTNRIGTRPITTEEITRGPIVGAPPDPSKWVLIREKTAGAHPGFTATDAKGETWFLEFDPPGFPEGATGAVAIATKIFWALGYNQVESFLTTFDPKKRDHRPEGDGEASERQADTVHAATT